ncbi:TlpA family protein disulfide reductase [Erythrobacter sp.]|uniref:TlpA family protein disulfide reductase n=1 Tax=Erythrobacter sp. TaxID=1042 RepID=UPI003C728424
MVPGLTLALLIGLLAGCDRGARESAQGGGTEAGGASETVAPSTGQIVRDFAGTTLPATTLVDPAGNTLDLRELDGPVLVNLWATWCAPCVVEMPMLDDLAGELGEDVRVLTISQDLRGADVVEPFFAERNFSYLEPWLDPEVQLTERFTQDGQLPLTVLFDAEGREVLRVVGAYEWNSEEAVALVREALE